MVPFQATEGETGRWRTLGTKIACPLSLLVLLMPQTLLALLSIMAFAYFALGSQRHDSDVERRAIATEVELAATDIAWGRITELERLAFDEEAAETGHVRLTPSSAPMGPEEASQMLYDDVDDWNGVEETQSVAVGAGTLEFNVEIVVSYVEDLAPSRPSATPTITKEVKVTVTELPSGPTDRVPATASLRRIITPISAAAVRR